MNWNHPLLKPLGIGVGTSLLVMEPFFVVGILKGWSGPRMEGFSAAALFFIALVLLKSVYQGPHAPRRGAWQRMTRNDYYVMQLQAQNRRAGIRQYVRTDLAAAAVGPLTGAIVMLILAFR